MPRFPFKRTALFPKVENFQPDAERDCSICWGKMGTQKDLPCIQATCCSTHSTCVRYFHEDCFKSWADSQVDLKGFFRCPFWTSKFSKMKVLDPKAYQEEISKTKKVAQTQISFQEQGAYGVLSALTFLLSMVTIVKLDQALFQ